MAQDLLALRLARTFWSITFLGVPSTRRGTFSSQKLNCKLGCWNRRLYYYKILFDIKLHLGLL